jgi:hypothetical protein
MQTEHLRIAYFSICAVTAVFVLRQARKKPLSAWYHLIFLCFYGPAFFFYWGEVGRTTAEFRCVGVLLLSLATTTAIVFLVPRMRPGKIAKRSLEKQESIRPAVFYGLSATVIVVTVYGLVAGGQLHRLKQGYSLTGRDVDSGYYQALRTDSDLIGNGQLSVKLLDYLSRHGIGPFLALVSLALWRKNRTSQALTFAGIMCLCILLAKASTLKKMDAVFFATQCGIVYTALSSTRERNDVKMAAKYAGVATLGIGGLSVMYLCFTNANSLSRILANIRIRVFEVPNYCLELYVTYFPDRAPFQNGMNVRLIHQVLSGGDNFVPAHTLINEAAGTANAIYIADAWVDWGWLGVAGFSIAVGCILRWAEGLFVGKSTPVGVAALVFLLDPVKALVSTSFITCAGGFGLVTVPLLAQYLTATEGNACDGRDVFKQRKFQDEDRRCLRKSLIGDAVDGADGNSLKLG